MIVCLNAPLLRKANFRQPYLGLNATFAQRILSGSVYFAAQGVLYDELKPHLVKRLDRSDAQADFTVGALTGAVSGLVSNPAAAVKYQMWNQRELSSYKMARLMYTKGGLRPFVFGIRATLLRDIVFGSSYELLRGLGDRQSYLGTLGVNFVSVGVATTLSSPFNCARNFQYRTSPDDVAPLMRDALTEVWKQSRVCSDRASQVAYIAKRLRIGWGTVRVMGGVTAGQAVFDYAKESLAKM